MKFPLFSLLLSCACGILLSPASAQYEELWRIGEDNGSQAEFSQEAGGANEAPGDAFALDDDYYLKGDYPDPIGSLDEDEDWFNFERAVTSGDPTVRIHFNLDEVQAHPLALFRLSFDMIALGSAGNGAGEHDLEFSFNDEMIATRDLMNAAELVQAEVRAGDVNAVAGENVVQVTRTGGTGSSWIQFDYVQMEVDIAQAGCVDSLCTFISSAEAVNPGQPVVLTWVGSPDAKFSIDQGIGSVDDETAQGLGSIEVVPGRTTTYTITATMPDASTAELSVTVGVRLITSFTSSTSAVAPEKPATLSWNVHPDAVLDLQPGVGAVDNNGGSGTVDVVPAAPSTKYTLTATLDGETQTAEVTVLVSTFVRIWQIGEDDGTQNDFSQESGVNPEPGNPAVKDDDYYFAGVYPAPIGLVAESEPWVNFERAVTSGDPTVRLHFNLNEVQAHPQAVYRIGFDMILLGSAAAGAGIHDLEYRMNGQLIAEALEIDAPVFVEAIVPAEDVNAEAGANVVEVTRVGQTDSSWIQFDFIRFEADTTAVGCAETLCSFTADNFVISAGQSVTLNWVAHPAAELTIDPPMQLETEAGQGTATLTPTSNTTYTLTATLNGDTVSESVTVRVKAIESFTATAGEVRAGEGFFLDWQVDPAAQVSISGIGPVDDDTFDGAGQLEIPQLTQTTTYTLTATRGADVETQSVTVAFNSYVDLWQIGEDDGSQAEFTQEQGGHSPPGDPDALDDDYYFAGTYEEIGVVEQDEEWVLFERALTTGNQFSRIHFNLSDDFADPATEFRLTLDLILLGGVAESIHDIEVRFNDNKIGEITEVAFPTLFRPVFTGEQAAAAAGENFIEIERVGGSTTGSWIQFDRITLEASATGAGGAGMQVTNVEVDAAGGAVTLTWNSRPNRTYLIQSTQNLTSWDEVTDGHASDGDSTSYTDETGFPESGYRYYRVMEE